MRLFADQDLYRGTVEFLREEGHDVITAAEVGLAKAPDPIILAHARRQARILVT